MDEELKSMLEKAHASGATDNDLVKIIKMYENDSALKKKVGTSVVPKQQVAKPMVSPSEGGSLASQQTEDISKLGLTKPTPAPVTPTPIPTEEQKQTLAAEQVASQPLLKEKSLDFNSMTKKLEEANKQKEQLPYEDPTLATKRAKSDIISNAKGTEANLKASVGNEDYNNFIPSILANIPKEIYNTSANTLDAVKNWYESKTNAPVPNEYGQIVDASTPFTGIADVASMLKNVINSALPQETKNTISDAITSASSAIKNREEFVKKQQELYPYPKNVVTNVASGLTGMIPDMAMAELVGPAAADVAAAKWSKKAETFLQEASPLIKKYGSEAIGLIERGVKSGFTKVLTAKGVVKGGAEDAENPYLNALIEGAKGFGEGFYMHLLGEGATAVAQPAAKLLGKMGVNSAISTVLTTPLANAGVFTGAKLIRTGIEEQRLATPEELEQEAAMGIGFSLMHIGSLYKNQAELNHYYDNVLSNSRKGDLLNSFGRVLNETRDNLDIAYNTDLDIDKTIGIINKMKSDIINEPDLQKKKMLGDAAILLQNQVDAKLTIDGVLKSKKAIDTILESNKDLTEEQRDFFTKKINAITERYDTSPEAVKTRELNQTIIDAQAELDKASKELSTSVLPSEKVAAQQKADDATVVLEKANSDLIEVVNAPKVEIKPEEVKIEEVKPNEVVEEVKPEEVKIEAPKEEMSDEAKKLHDLLNEKLSEPEKEAPAPKRPRKAKAEKPVVEVTTTPPIVIEAPKLEMPKVEEQVVAEAPKVEIPKEELSDKEKSDLIKKDNELRDKSLEIEDKLRAEGLKTVDLMKHPELVDIQKQRDDINNKLNPPKEEAPVAEVQKEKTTEDKIEEEYSKEFYRISDEKKAIRESDLKKEEKEAELNKLSTQLGEAVKKRNDLLEVEKKNKKVEKSFQLEEVPTEEEQKMLDKIDELQSKIKESKGKEKTKLQDELQKLIRGNLEDLQTRFRIAKENAKTLIDEAEVEKIKEQMNMMSDIEAGFEEPSDINKTRSVNPIDESKSTDKKSALEKLKKFFGKDNKTPLIQRTEDFNNIPMIFGMSDILAAGNIVDAMNRTMKVGGGKMFNVLGDDIDLAWAGVNKEGAQRQYDDAVKLYNGHKELFQRLWDEGKLPDGHVPMAIMRMGNTAINSNEAVFRYIEPYVSSLPEVNRKAALDEFIKSIRAKAEGNSASIWYTDLADKIENGQIKNIEEIHKYLEDIINDESSKKAKKEAAEKFLAKTKQKKGKEIKKFDDIKSEIDIKVEKLIPFVIIEHIKEKGITTLDGLLKEIIEQSKKRAEGENNIFTLPTRSYIYDKLFSPETSAKNNLKPIVALLKGVEGARPELFTSKHIYEALGEPSMLAAKQGDFVSVVGIKVAEKGKDGEYKEAGGVKKTKGHNNYGFGPEGRAISLIENPKHGIDVFPEFKAKAVRIFKESKKGEYPSIEAVANQTGGAFFADDAFKGARPMYNNISDLSTLIGKLRFAFPDVHVTTTKEEFDKALNEPGVRTRETEGKILYGMTKDGKIYLNPDYDSLNTPIHEFGHVWIDYLGSKASGKRGDMLLAKGLELVNGTKEYDNALEKYGEHSIALEEALVELIANKGVTIIDAAKKSRFLSWMNATFKYIKDNFTKSKNIDNDKIKDLTLDEFINIGLADLLSGEKVNAKFSPTEIENAKARFALDDKMSKIIDIARENKFSDNAIKEVLKSRGYSEEQIAEAFPKKEREFVPTTQVKEVFNNNSKLSEIGSVEQYSNYLNSIFPDSEVKNVLYHGGNEGISKFDKNKLGENTKAESALLGFFFSDNKNLAKSYIEKDYISYKGNYLKYLEDAKQELKDIENESIDIRSKVDKYDKVINNLINNLKDLIKKLFDSKYITTKELYNIEIENLKKIYNKISEKRIELMDLDSLSTFLEKTGEKYFDNAEIKQQQKENKKLYTVVLDLKNPDIVDKENDPTGGGKFYSDNVREAINKGKDGVILKNVLDIGKFNRSFNGMLDDKTEYNDVYKGNDYVVLEPEQIHILGNDEDVKGFKEFVSSNKEIPKKEREFTKPLDILSNAAKADLKIRKDEIAKGIDKIVEKGNITLKNAEGLKSKLERLNVSNETQVKKFLDYAEKMFTKKPTIEYIREAYKATVNDIKNRRVTISDAIKEMVKRGSITTKQASNLIARLEKLNVQSDVMTNRFLDYAKKVFDKADYVDKLSEGNKTKKEIAKLAKDKKKNVELTTLAKKFNEIKPSMVHDIEQYNEMASIIKDALVGVKAIGENVKLNKSVKIDDAERYIDYTINNQNKQLYEERLAEVQEMMGVDASEFTYEELNNFFENEKATDKYKETIIKDTIKKMFDTYSGVIDEMFKTGYDAFFTDEKYPFTEKEKEIGKRFMDMDLSLLNTRQQLDAINSIQNFLENHSTAKMEDTLSKYTGELKARELEKANIKARDLKLYASENIGRLFADQFTSLPLLFEKMFGGVNAGGKVQDAMGITELTNKKSGAAKKSEMMVNDYVEKFKDTKPNGKAFNEGSNIIERGLAAHMMRSLIGTKEEKAAEFELRKGWIEQSIEKLKNGTEKEKEKATLYQDAYDKLLKDSKNIEQVKSKTDKENLKAVDWWINKWAENYEQMSDVSLNVYNKILEKDSNYTPDRMTPLETKKEKVDLSSNESQFHQNNGTTYKKESGSLMKAEKNATLPKDRYIDLSFDTVNSNAMYDALIDVTTAATIRRVESFINSDAYDKIFPNAEDASLLKDRVQSYIRNIRRKNIYQNDTFSKTMNHLNSITNAGVTLALGGPSQAFKQVIPVVANTIINAGKIDLGVLFNEGQIGFIDRSERAIANRGSEAQTGVESINKVLDQAAKSPLGKATQLIGKANNMYLNLFLKHPDVFVAKASWITYYEKSLKQQGVDISKLDYKTDKINDEAADFAQRMVDRQQNISDHDMAGEIFNTKDGYGKFIRNTVMPFASFRMNQSIRMMTDISNLQHWKTMSVEDRKIAAKSLAGFAVEMATFKAVSMGMSLLWGSLANMIMNNHETKDEKKKRIASLTKGVATSAITDTFSPLPILDKPTAWVTNELLNTIQDISGVAEDDKWSIYGGTTSEMAQSFGTLGIAAGKAYKLAEAIQLARKGKYTDDYGHERKLSHKGKDGAKYAATLYLLGSVGVLPPAESASIANNMIKVAKKKTITPL